MIIISTDFGSDGPYLGQMKAVLAREAPGVTVLDLFANLPAFEIQAAAYLLAAYINEFPAGSVFLCVVDPGVGSDRRAAIIKADGRWFIGPDNGLFNVIVQRAEEVEWWDIQWRPERLSHSFHGRDLFAPVAARIARGEKVAGVSVEPASRLLEGWPPELSKIVYVDHYGNLMTGIRLSSVEEDSLLQAGDQSLHRAITFSSVEPGQAFWYGNANGLIEIAVNQGRADKVLGLQVGDRVHFQGRL
jgi:S-adenosylmethionine hydrolase